MAMSLSGASPTNDPEPMLDINTTPLIDVMLVLIHHVDHHDSDPDARGEAEHAGRNAAAAGDLRLKSSRSKLIFDGTLIWNGRGAREPQGARAEATRRGRAAGAAGNPFAPEQAC
jgi:hypothetical protein